MFSNKEVETRVVEMEFDNKQFEKGAEQTMSTLDKLKKSLDFKNVNSGLDTLQKSIDNISFKGIESQVDSIDAAFTTLAGRIKVNFFDQIANYIINAGVQLERSTIGQIISGGKSRAMNIATAKFKMEGMGVTWDQIFKDLDYAVAGTAYGLDAAANIGSQLVASGVQVGDDMATALRAVSGVAAMTSSSYEEIGNIFAAVAGQGKVMAMQLNQLSLRGINAYATLGKYLNMTEAEVRDVVSKGQIDFQTFANAMDEAFGEHAKEANKTFTGAMSNVKAALSKIGQMFYSPFYDAMINPLNLIREGINDVKNALTDTKDGTVVSFERRLAEVVKLGGEMLEILIKIARIGITEVVKNVDKLNTKMDGVINTMKSVKKWMEKAIPEDAEENLKAVEDGINGITEAEIKAAKNIWEGPNIYGDNPDRRKNLEAEALSYERVQMVLDECAASNITVEASLKKLGYTISDTTKKTDEASGSYKKMSDSAKIITNMMQVFSLAFKNAVKIAGAARDALHDIFPSTGEHKALVLISEGLLNLMKKISLSEKDVDNLRKTFGGLLSIVRFFYDIFSAVVHAFKGATSVFSGGNSIILSLTGAIGDLITKFVRLIEATSLFPRLITSLQGKMEKLIEKFIKFVGVHPEKWADVLYSKAEKFADFIDKHSFEEIVDALKNKIIALYKTVKKKIELREGIFGSIADGASKVGKVLGGAITYIKDFLGIAADFIRNVAYIFSGHWDRIVTNGKNSIAEHFQHMTESIDSIVTTFTNTINNLLNKLNSVDPAKVESATKKNVAISGSVSTLLSNVKTDVNVDKEQVSGILDGVKDIVAIFATFVTTISFYKLSDGIQSFGQGFESLTYSIETVSKKMARAIRRISMGMTFKYISEGVKALAIALLLVVASIAGLTYVANKDNMDAVWRAATVIMALIGELGLLVFIIAKFSSFPGVATIFGAAVMFFGMAAALALLVYSIKTVTDNLALKRRLTILVNAVWQVTRNLILLGGALAIIYSVITKILIKKTGITSSINELNKMLLALSASVLMMTLAIAIFAILPRNRLDNGIQGLLAVLSMISLAVWAMMLSFRGNKYGTSLNDKNIKELSKMLRSLSVSLFILVGSFAVLTAIIGLLGTNKNGKKAIITASIVMAGMFAVLVAAVFGIFAIAKNFPIETGAIKAIQKLMTSMTIMIAVLALSFVAIAYSLRNVWNESVQQAIQGSMIELIVGFIALVAIVTGVASSIRESDIPKIEALTKIIDSITVCMISITAAFSILSMLIMVDREATLYAVSAILLSFFGIIWTFDHFVGKTNFQKTSAEQFKTMAEAFLMVSLSLIGISAAFSLLIFAISNNKMSAGDAATIIVAFVGGIATILGTLYLMTKYVAKRTIGKIVDFAKSFLLISLGIAALSAGMSLMFEAVNAMDQDAAPIIEALAKMALVILGAVYFTTKLKDANKTLDVGIALASVMASFALSILAIAAAIWVIGKFNIDLSVLDKFTVMFTGLLLLVDMAAAISTSKNFNIKNVIAVAGLIVLTIASIAGFMLTLAAIDWDSFVSNLERIPVSAIVGFISVIVLLVEGPLLMLEAATQKANGQANEYAKMAVSFALIMGSLAFFAITLNELLATVFKTNISGENLGIIFGSFIAAIVLILGTLAVLSKGFKASDTANMIAIAGSFALIAAGLSAVALSLAVIFSVTKEMDTVKIITVLGMFTILTAVMEMVVNLMLTITDSKKAIVSGLAASVGLLSLSAVLVALGGALWVIGKMGISTDTIDKVSIFMAGILLVFSVLSKVAGSADFKAINVILASGGLVISLMTFAGFLSMLAAIDYESLENVLMVLSKHELFTTLSILIPLLLVVVGMLGGVKLGLSLQVFATGLLEVAAAFLALAFALYLVAKAVAVLKSAQGGVNLDDLGSLSDKTIAYNAVGRTTGEYFAEGLRRGLVDSQGNLTDAGRIAMGYVITGVNSEGQIHSPSRVGEWQGEMYADGIIEGIENERVTVYNASQTLGESMINGFADSMVAADPSKYVQTITSDMTQAYSDTIQNGFESAQDSVQDGFGDFAFDYSEAFDDAPITPTVTPVIDADELDNQVQAVRQDETLGLTPTIDLSGLSDISVDTDSMMGTLGLGEGENLTGSIEDMLTGEDGLSGEIDKIINGEDGKGGLANDITTSLFGTKGTGGLTDNFNDIISGQDGILSSLTEGDSSLTSLFSGLSSDITGSSGFGGLGAILGDSLGKEGLITGILKEILIAINGEGNILTGFREQTNDEAYSMFSTGHAVFNRGTRSDGTILAFDPEENQWYHWEDDQWIEGYF